MHPTSQTTHLWKRDNNLDICFSLIFLQIEHFLKETPLSVSIESKNTGGILSKHSGSGMTEVRPYVSGISR